MLNCTHLNNNAMERTMNKKDAAEFVDDEDDKYIDNDTMIELDEDFYYNDDEVQADFYLYSE